MKITEKILNKLKESNKILSITDDIITWTIEPENIEDAKLQIKSTKVTLTEKAPERVEKLKN